MRDADGPEPLSRVNGRSGSEDPRSAPPRSQKGPQSDGEATAAADPSGKTDRPAGLPVGEIVDLTPPAQVARAALNRAKAAARARGLRPGTPARRTRDVEEPKTSGARPDGRDPQLVSFLVGSLLSERGWTAEVSVGSVMGRWREVVGDQIAEHCTPERFEDKSLVVRADSTAWATQVRLLGPRLLERIAQEVGAGVVDSVTVLGPSGPSFRRGRRAVQGPGPGDTWG